MLFNSFGYFIFLFIVWMGYCALPGKASILWLFGASLFFYSWWNPYNLPIMLFIIAVNHYCARWMDTAPSNRARKGVLVISVCLSISVLAFFKYRLFLLNLFTELSGIDLTGRSALQGNHLLAGIGIPLGISFFTFQSIGYLVDCYRRVIRPEKSFWRTCLFISYFPHLIAGPIMRGKDLFPQIAHKNPITIENIKQSILPLAMGLFKKVVVADNLALLSDAYFASPTGGIIDAWVAILSFTFQIYADFSGYTDMAIGSAKLFGITLSPNFNRPYYKTNITDFWRSWNMTLSFWFRDYVYISLGGSKRGTLLFYRNLILTMLLSGLWHGANITYVIWGLYHGVLLMIHKYMKRHLLVFGHLPAFFRGLCVFFLVAVGFIVFRSKNLATAFHIIGQAFFSGWTYDSNTDISAVVGIPLLMAMEGLCGERLGLIRRFEPLRYVFTAALLFMVFLLNTGYSNQFIYFIF